jgi:pimeloyl-ACP methyl ester carboxylesterase
METHYARSGDVSIAYRIEGDGPVDVALVPGVVSHVEAFDELPGYARFVRSLARHARVITFDKRGNGLSERVAEPPSLVERVADVRAVLDAAGSRRTILFGTSEGGPMSLLFAAMHPERTAALILFGSFARALAAPGYDALTREAYEAFAARTVDGWGTGASLVGIFGPSLEGDPNVRAIAARCERLSATPATLRALWRMNGSIDVRNEAAAVRAPTLVMHRRGDRVIPVTLSRWLAAHVPGAELVELDGDDHFPFVGDSERVIREVGRFLEHSGIHTAAFESTMAAPLEGTNEMARLFTLASLDEPLELGRFVVQRQLGSGGMGSVYLALDRDLSRQVAIKVLHATEADGFGRFRREAIATARTSHPNVVQIHELGLDAKAPYIVMEYLPGGPTSRLAVVPWRRACRIVQSAASGLGAAHAVGIVHRDIKPANLLLISSDGDEVKVADFGVAKLTGAEPLTQDGAIVGTIGFLSPEQIHGRVVDARTDIYALGVTLFQFLTGRAPFGGTPAECLAAAASRSVPDPRTLVPDVPANVAALVAQMCALDAEVRPADGATAAEALAAVLGVEP